MDSVVVLVDSAAVVVESARETVESAVGAAESAEGTAELDWSPWLAADSAGASSSFRAGLTLNK